MQPVQCTGALHFFFKKFKMCELQVAMLTCTVKKWQASVKCKTYTTKLGGKKIREMVNLMSISGSGF